MMGNMKKLRTWPRLVYLEWLPQIAQTASERLQCPWRPRGIQLFHSFGLTLLSTIEANGLLKYYKSRQMGQEWLTHVLNPVRAWFGNNAIRKATLTTIRKKAIQLRHQKDLEITLRRGLQGCFRQCNPVALSLL